MGCRWIYFTFVKVAKRVRRYSGKEDLRLVGFESIITGGLTVIVYTLIVIAVYRVFQIGTDVGEMKQLLKDIRRNTAPADSQGALTTVTRPDSAEALVRAIHAASYQELDDTIAEPATHKPA